MQEQYVYFTNWKYAKMHTEYAEAGCSGVQL